MAPVGVAAGMVKLIEPEFATDANVPIEVGEANEPVASDSSAV